MDHPLRAQISRARETFWILPAIGVLLGLAFGMLLPRIDVDLPDALVMAPDTRTARTLLTAIASIGVSIAGVSFSVIVVALVLAAQQLSPRVLQSFQRQLLNQFVLALLLGTAIYSLLVLGQVGGEVDQPVPDLATLIALVLAAVSLCVFVVFLHHAIRSLNPSAVIRRVAAYGHEALSSPWPEGVGEARPGSDALAGWEGAPVVAEIEAPRAGYLSSIAGERLVAWASEHDVLVEQHAGVGDFVVTGGRLARVRGRGGDVDPGDIHRAFILEEERSVEGDIAFPIRQLADIALRGLSPSLNDPTTAENAMDSVTDTLVRFARLDLPAAVRLDADGTARLRARAPGVGELVRLGFDQVRRHAASQPSFAVRLLELLADLREVSDDPEIARQAAMTAEQAEATADLEADRRMIREAHERLHG